MHFTIPFTEDISDESGRHVELFKVFVNGGHLCSARYSAFYNLYERLKHKGLSEELPAFPPKKLLKLSVPQLQERRRGLEDFLQKVSSSSNYNSEELHQFLQQSQQETKGIIKEAVRVVIYQMNGDHYDIDIQTTDHTKAVLETLADNINLPKKVTSKFGLFLVIVYDDDRVSIVRQLQDFEYPYVSLKELTMSCNGRIVVRKSVWNLDLEDEIISDVVGLDLLYGQIVAEIRLGWIILPDDARRNRLDQLIHRAAKKEVLLLARTLHFYGYVHIFDVSICNIPEPNTQVLVSTGNFELLFRNPKNEMEILHKFSLIRIKGWRICTVVDEDEGVEEVDRNKRQNFNRPYSATLTFEYLDPVHKSLDSIEISHKYTNQIILLSMSLKSMAEEYVRHKSTKNIAKDEYESFVDGRPKVECTLVPKMYKSTLLYTKEIGDDDL